MQSRHLGEIKLDPANSMQATVQFEGSSLPFSFTLAHPTRATDGTIEDVDMVLDQLTFLNDLGKQTIISKLQETSSPAAQFYRAWESRHPFGQASLDTFIASLRPARISVQPDGGLAQPERVLLSYALTDSPLTSTLAVRYLEPTGPELAPAPPGGYL